MGPSGPPLMHLSVKVSIHFEKILLECESSKLVSIPMQQDCLLILIMYICRRSDYIIGFIAPAIGPQIKNLTRLIVLAHNIRGKV